MVAARRFRMSLLFCIEARIKSLNKIITHLNKINNLFEQVINLCIRHNKSFERVIMLSKQVTNLCVRHRVV